MVLSSAAGFVVVCYTAIETDTPAFPPGAGRETPEPVEEGSPSSPNTSRRSHTLACATHCYVEAALHHGPGVLAPGL